jgi:hypothetical protein
MAQIEPEIGGAYLSGSSKDQQRRHKVVGVNKIVVIVPSIQGGEATFPGRVCLTVDVIQEF